MFFKSKLGSLVFIVIGVMIALGNGYLYLVERSALRALVFFAGIAWIWIGVSYFRDAQNGDP